MKSNEDNVIEKKGVIVSRMPGLIFWELLFSSFLHFWWTQIWIAHGYDRIKQTSSLIYVDIIFVMDTDDSFLVLLTLDKASPRWQELWGTDVMLKLV